MLSYCLGRAHRARLGIALSILAVASVHGQMTIPTSGTIPSGFLNQSLILGDDLSQLQNQWTTPASSVQTGWRNNINSYANGSINATPPTTFNQAASQASIAQSAGFRFAMTGSVSDLSKVVTALVNADVPTPPANDFIIRPEVLTSYLSAYDYIRGASLADLPNSTRTTIETRLANLANSLGYGNQTYSNARAKIGGTKALAGVILQNQQLLDTGLTDLSGHFAYSTTDDGWFTDSPGHYLSYTLRHLGLFARAYQQGSGVDLTPTFEPYINMTIALRLPSGVSPNVSNGMLERPSVHVFSQATDPTAASLAMWNMTSGVPANYNGFADTALLNNDNSQTVLMALVDWSDVTPAVPLTSPTYLASGQSKIAVFRTDWSTMSDYLLLSPGIDSPATVFGSGPNSIIFAAFHNHNDTGEILLASKGEYILVAPGYNRTDLSNSPSGFTPQTADWHNVILVDGNTGILGGLLPSPNQGATMRPEDFVQSNRLDSTELGNFKGVGDFSSLQMSYNDATVTRSTAFPHEDYFVVADRITSASSHTYGFNLVGRGVQTVLHSSATRIEVQWESNGARVIEHLFSSLPMTLTTDTRWMHVNFNEFEQTYRMLAEVNGQDALFLSVLETGHANTPSSLAIQQVAMGPEALALIVAHATDGWTDTILTQLGHTLLSAGDLSTDAMYATMRKEAGQLVSLMLAEGTTLLDQGALVIDLTERATLSVLFETDLALGTISADGLISGTELRFHERGLVTGAWLNGSAISFSNDGGIGTVILNEAGELRVEFSTVPEASSFVLALLGTGAVWAFLTRKF